MLVMTVAKGRLLVCLKRCSHSTPVSREARKAAVLLSSAALPPVSAPRMMCRQANQQNVLQLNASVCPFPSMKTPSKL